MTDDKREPKYSCEEDDTPHTLGMFRPIHAPMSWMYPIEPRIREDGRVLKRFRFLHPTEGSIYEEDPLDIVPQYEIVEVCPMPMPTGGIFDLDYAYGKEAQDKSKADFEKEINAVVNKEQE